MNQASAHQTANARKVLNTSLSLLLVALGILCCAADGLAGSPSGKVVIRVFQYRMISGDPAYKSLETLIPMALTYRLQADPPSPDWVVFFSAGPGEENAPRSAPLGKGEPFQQKEDRKEMAFGEAPLTLSIAGTYLEVDGKIRLFHQIYTAGTKDLLASRSMTFDATDGLSALSNMADQLAAAIQAHRQPVSSPSKKPKIMVTCFQQVVTGTTSTAEEAKDLSWLGLEISRQISVDLRKRQRFSIVPEKGDMPDCKEKMETLLTMYDPDIVIAGEFYISRENQLNAAANIIEISGNKSVGPILVSGAPKNYFNLGAELSESVLQVLTEALDERGQLIIQGSFSGDVTAEEYYAKGRLYLADGYEAIAVLMFTKSLEKNNGQPEIHLELAKIFQERGDLRRAAKAALTAAEQNPDTEESHLLLGRIYFTQGELEKAYDVYSRWLARRRSAKALVQRGNILLFQDKLDDAMSDYREALSIDPENPEAHTAIGTVHLYQGRYRVAVESFRDALSRKDSSAARQGLANAHMKIGIQYIEEKKYDGAVDRLKQSIEVYPTSEAYGRLAQASFSMGKVDEAHAAVLASVELGENRAWPHAGLGRILYAKKEYQQAIEELRIALEIEPDHGFANLYLGKTYHALDQNKLAIRHLEKCFDVSFNRSEYRWAAQAMDSASKIEPKNAVFAGYAGESYRMMLQFDKAIDRLQKAVDLDPTLAWTHGLLGICYAQRKEYDKAIQPLEAAVVIDPELDWAYAHLGTAYYESGEVDRAVESILASLEINPEQPWMQYQLALIYMENKQDSQKALEHAKQAIDVASKLPDSQVPDPFRSCLPEILITLGRYDEAIRESEEMARRATKENTRLNMIFSTATAQILKGRRSEAESTMKELLDAYSSVSATYQNNWIYNGILNYVDHCKCLNENSIEMIHIMTQLLNGRLSQGAFMLELRRWSDASVDGSRENA